LGIAALGLALYTLFHPGVRAARAAANGDADLDDEVEPRSADHLPRGRGSVHATQTCEVAMRDRRCQRVVRAVAALVLLAAGVAASAALAPSAGAAEVPWVCSQDAFLFQSPDGLDGEHLVQQVDLVTGENHRLGETADQVNAVG